MHEIERPQSNNLRKSANVQGAGNAEIGGLPVEVDESESSACRPRGRLGKA
jgi:hypothetical protein